MQSQATCTAGRTRASSCIVSNWRQGAWQQQKRVWNLHLLWWHQYCPRSGGLATDIQDVCARRYHSLEAFPVQQLVTSARWVNEWVSRREWVRKLVTKIVNHSHSYTHFTHLDSPTENLGCFHSCTHTGVLATIACGATWGNKNY